MVNEIVKHFGGVAETARALGVTQPAVSQWLRYNYMPPARAVQVEDITGGLFKATEIVRGVSHDGD